MYEYYLFMLTLWISGLDIPSLTQRGSRPPSLKTTEPVTVDRQANAWTLAAAAHNTVSTTGSSEPCDVTPADSRAAMGVA